MKTRIVLLGFLIGAGGGFAGKGALAAGPGNDARPPWEDLHMQLEQRVAAEVELARRSAEAEQLHRRQLWRDETPLRDPAGKSPASAPRAENRIDRATYAWLTEVVRRPIPEESELRNIFRAEGVPEDLIYVGLVESGYQQNAVSAAGAVGPWQFIGETGRRYGLVQGKAGDDRRDLLKSTRAAAHYLRDLHELLGDWTLAVAGYNAGENRVLRAMQLADTSDFGSLRPYLPKETAAYVPRVLAAISLAKGVRLAGTGTGNFSPDIRGFKSAGIE